MTEKSLGLSCYCPSTYGYPSNASLSCCKIWSRQSSAWRRPVTHSQCNDETIQCLFDKSFKAQRRSDGGQKRKFGDHCNPQVCISQTRYWCDFGLMAASCYYKSRQRQGKMRGDAWYLTLIAQYPVVCLLLLLLLEGWSPVKVTHWCTNAHNVLPMPK